METAVPFSFPEPGVLHLVIPETGWDPDDRSAFMQALTRSCAEGPTGLLLESNTKRVSPEGPNLMLALFEQLQDRIVCMGVSTTSSLLQLTLVAFRAAAGLRGIRFPIEAADQPLQLREWVMTQTRAKRAEAAPAAPQAIAG
jgi:hypothetical protein